MPTEDAAVVERARRAGAIVIGKTNTPEFGCKGVTDNLIFGHTRNPWRLDRIAGGSSGGRGAAVAAGLGPIAEGSDLAGSIRIPAAVCGVVGLKPSLGRIPRARPNGWTALSHVGPLTRTVRDAALALSVWAGPDERDPQSPPATGDDFARAADGGIHGLRIGWSPDLGYAAVDPEIRASRRPRPKVLARRCRRRGGHPGFDDPFRSSSISPRPSERPHGAPLGRVGRSDGSVPRPAQSHGEKMSAIEWERATHRRTAFWHTVRRLFERYDLLVTPTTSVAAFPIGLSYPAEIEGRKIDNQLQWFPFTFPFSITGQPAITVPCGFTAEGLPVGLQIVGKRFADATVLRAAAAFEAAQPWVARRPRLSTTRRRDTPCVASSSRCSSSSHSAAPRRCRTSGSRRPLHRRLPAAVPHDHVCIYDRLNSQTGSTPFTKGSLSGGLSNSSTASRRNRTSSVPGSTR